MRLHRQQLLLGCRQPADGLGLTHHPPLKQVRKFDGRQQQVTLRRPVRALPSPVTTRLDTIAGGERVGTIRLASFNARAQVRSSAGVKRRARAPLQVLGRASA